MGFLLVLTGCPHQCLGAGGQAPDGEGQGAIRTLRRGTRARMGGAGKAPWSWGVHAEFSRLLVMRDEGPSGPNIKYILRRLKCQYPRGRGGCEGLKEVMRGGVAGGDRAERWVGRADQIHK